MNDLPNVPQDNWKPQVYAAGGLAGLIIGFLAAYFYARASEETTPDQPARIRTMDALKLGVSLLSLLRQITDLGALGDKK
jgi:hypothetical protein